MKLEKVINKGKCCCISIATAITCNYIFINDSLGEGLELRFAYYTAVYCFVLFCFVMFVCLFARSFVFLGVSLILGVMSFFIFFKVGIACDRFLRGVVIYLVIAVYLSWVNKINACDVGCKCRNLMSVLMELDQENNNNS